MRKLFGTDGIRGVANVPPMDSETALKLGRAIAMVFGRDSGRHKILIGKDTRVSGYMLETALESGISSMGVDVLLVGPLPTPGIAFMTKSMRADAGIVISASHNSYEDNGIKFFGADGFKLADKTEEEIERLINSNELDTNRATPAKIGKAFRLEDAVGRYTVFLKNCVERECKFDGLKIVLDTAHGATYRVAPQVFTELGATIITTGDKPNGRNINEQCGSLYPEVVSKLTVDNHYDCGIAFDGDGDRVLLCDEKGKVFDGDLILAMLAQDFSARKQLTGDGVVGTVMSNFGLEIALKKLGLKLYRSDVGDRYVLTEMLDKGINIGGEQSGHLISLDHNTTGDGLLTALLIVAILVKTGKPLSYYSSLIEKYPQVLINVPVKVKKPFNQLPKVSSMLKDAEKKLKDKGRILLRYSGTESKARVMVECDDDKLCNSIASEIAECIKSEL